ncbi:23S rRNA (uracil(1939)-C(5))-methyltransferase RlmD [Candidatus Saccharibacteria bacterium]|nr:23S rRNA (uracil(1939)-C(5))-methyltransferase RlmD [Candidatus Saccharibacteria bacterium]
MSERIAFTKVVADGQAMGYWHDKAVFVPGPLAGEVAEVEITNEKTKSAQGVVERYIEVSEHRSEAVEDHFAACSPWQGVAYDQQLEQKRGMLSEAFARPGLQLPIDDVIGADKPLGYRNKLEFKFVKTGTDQLGLAFHDRGSATKFVAAPAGCVLGSARMNEAAKRLAHLLGKMGLADLADTLMIRESQTGTGMVAIITLKSATTNNWLQLKLADLTGVAVIVKQRHNKIETLWSEGSLALGETIAGVEQFYPWDSFFQTNVPMFERALDRILDAIPHGSRVVDLYGGAGSIGLAAARSGALSVVGVDIVRASVEVARRNGKRNGLTNYRAIIATSERMDPAIIRSADVVIVDPPRAGLATKVVDTLIDCSPKRIIYLSCNPITQVRDLLLFQTGGYEVASPLGFDFYPGTLHLESLVVLIKSKPAKINLA